MTNCYQLLPRYVTLLVCGEIMPRKFAYFIFFFFFFASFGILCLSFATHASKAMARV